MRLDLHLLDSVFVMGQGYGRVAKILPDGSFVVAVPGRGEQHFSAAGTLGSSLVRKLYYQDPIIVEPPKNKAVWLAYKRLAEALYKEVAALSGSGDLALPEEEEEEEPVA